MLKCTDTQTQNCDKCPYISQGGLCRNCFLNLESQFATLAEENKRMREWISVKDKLPSAQNGYIDRLVLVCVKNKNKEDGIYLQDISSFDGESWSERFHTWEDITHWKPLSEPPKE